MLPIQLLCPLYDEKLKVFPERSRVLLRDFMLGEVIAKYRDSITEDLLTFFFKLNRGISEIKNVIHRELKSRYQQSIGITPKRTLWLL